MISKMKAVMLVPVSLFFTLFTLVPLVRLILLSFYKTNFIVTKFVFFDNYLSILFDEKFLLSIFNSLFYSLLLAPSQVFFGLVGAIAVFCLSKKWQDVSRIIFYVPVLASGIIIAQVWKWVFSTNGPANWFLSLFNVQSISWFSQGVTGIPVVSYVVLISSFGANVILLLSSLLDIDKGLFEAADIDGASFMKKIFFIIIPSLSSSLKIVFIVSTVAAFQIYETILALCPYEYTSTMTFLIYSTGFRNGKYGEAAAQSVFLVLIVAVLLLIQKRIKNEKK